MIVKFDGRFNASPNAAAQMWEMSQPCDGINRKPQESKMPDSVESILGAVVIAIVVVGVFAALGPLVWA